MGGFTSDASKTPTCQAAERQLWTQKINAAIYILAKGVDACMWLHAQATVGFKLGDMPGCPVARGTPTFIGFRGRGETLPCSLPKQNKNDYTVQA
eukprot:5479170-Amphidinium_carterae.1